MIVNIAYDYRITIVIRGYEICAENEIKWIVCLETSRGIDPMPIRDKSLQHTNLFAPFGYSAFEPL